MEKTSYRQILKSSSIMGGAAGINMLFGMVRIKFTAIFIGSVGVGIMANFAVIQSLIGTVAGLGIQSSAVRDMANAEAANDQHAIGRAALTLRRVSWITGLLGAGVMVGLSPLLSQWTFGNGEYTLEIAMLGITILFGNISGGQLAMIQGMQRIGDLARINVISAGVSTLVSIGFYAWLGVRGIVPALLMTAAIQLATSWFFARRIYVPEVSMTWIENFYEAGGMVRLGVAFMWSALMVSAVCYATNAVITQQISLTALGIYSAAFALSGMFVNFVLGAMGADYYPRLSSAAPDKEAMNRLVNEQTEIGLLLAVPGLLATLSLAPWIIQVFYTQEFLPAANLLQWFVLGCLIRIIQWPMGFLQLALTKGDWFFITQTSLNALHLLFIWLGIMMIGIEGASIAFFLLYVVSLGVIMLVARHLTGFRWNIASRKLLMTLLPVVAATFVAGRLLPLWLATISGIVATMIASVLCLRGLIHRVGYEHRVVRTVCKIPGLRMVCGL